MPVIISYMGYISLFDEVFERIFHRVCSIICLNVITCETLLIFLQNLKFPTVAVFILIERCY